jgi:enoyl-CoA hydratase/carnithine racemase
VEADEQIRVAILASSYLRVFCAGADIKEIVGGRDYLLSTPGHGFAGIVDAPGLLEGYAANHVDTLRIAL